MDKFFLRQIFSILLASSMFVIFVGCGGSKSSTYAHSGYSADRMALNSKAQSLYSQAKDTPDIVAKTSLLVDSLYLYSKAANITLANEVLQQLKPKKSLVLAEDNNKINLAHANIDYFQGEYTRALSALHRINVNNLNTELKKDYHNIKSQVFYKQSNITNAAEELISLNDLLDNSLDIKINNTKIWSMLRELTPNQLYAQLDNQTLSDELRGWINFNYVNKKYDINQSQVAQRLRTWKKRYEGHAANNFLPDIAIDSNQSYSTPKKIGLMLPLSGGPHVKSALAVKNGFIASLYNFYEQNKSVPVVKVYDTSAYDVDTLFHKAMEDRVEMIVGPLTKENVKKISRYSLKIPVLALNVANDNNFFSGKKNLYEFGLLPEDEAIAVANKARFDGHINAAIITPNNEWGKRTASAFSREWNNIGGNVVVNVEFNSDNLNDSVKYMLGIDKSSERASKLKKLGVSLDYTPRRRQDIDFVFIAASPSSARQIKPLLNFHYAKDLPVYATSSIYTGDTARRFDQDLNNIVFCDMPWVLDNSIKDKNIYIAIKSKWPMALKSHPRLFALGVDAYKLSQQLEQLNNLSEIGVSGVSGILKLQNSNVIRRQLMWAKFVNGEATLAAN